MSLGIDIGKYSIKVVELSSSSDTIEVVKIGSYPIFNNINKSNIENGMFFMMRDLMNQGNKNPTHSILKNIKRDRSSV